MKVPVSASPEVTLDVKIPEGFCTVQGARLPDSKPPLVTIGEAAQALVTVSVVVCVSVGLDTAVAFIVALFVCVEVCVRVTLDVAVIVVICVITGSVVVAV